MKLLFGVWLLLMPLCWGNAQHSWAIQTPGHAHLLTEHTEGCLQTKLGHILGTLGFNWHEAIQDNANVSQQCSEDLSKLRQDVMRMKSYALHMLDACGKPPSGILTGNLYWTGSYAQCIKVTRGHNNITFDGKYFRVKLELSDGANQTSHILLLGMCLPSSCSDDDVTQGLASSLSLLPSFLHGRVVGVRAQQPVAPIRAGTVVATCICGVICVLLLLGTMYDVIIARPRKAADTDGKLSLQTTNFQEDMTEQLNLQLLQGEESWEGTEHLETNDGELPSANVAVQPEGIAGRILVSFSLYNNVDKLLSTKQSADSIRCLHGVRVISMSWVILGHTVYYSVGTLDNPLAIVERVKTFAFQPIPSAVTAVDTFFFLSGLLMTYHLLKRLEKTMEEGKWMALGKLYILRYCRLTPTYLFVIIMATWTMPQMFCGPMWGHVGSVRYCWANWWTNVLYINNLVYADHGCLGWTWYLACDMQFFVVGVPIVYLLYRLWYVGFPLKFLLLAANFVATAMLAAKYGVRADYLRAEGLSMDHLVSAEFYFKPWVRISPYLVGMAVGWILFKTREMRVENKLGGKTILGTVTLGWCTAAASALALVYGLYGAYNGAGLTDAVNLLYLTVHTTVWAMAVAWVVLACHHGYGGVVNTILSWNVWVPLSRLTYSAYLLHPLVMYVAYHLAETTLHLTTITMMYQFLGHLVLSYGLAVLLFVAVESPVASLLKIIVEKRKTNEHRRLSG